MTDSLDAYLVLSGLLFAIGTFGFLARRNAISMLMSIELMLNGVNLAIVAFGSFGVARAVAGAGASEPAALVAQGSVIALMVMAVAAPNEPNATIARLTPLSISSIDISMLIALRRARNPNVPIAKSSPERTR